VQRKATIDTIEPEYSETAILLIRTREAQTIEPWSQTNYSNKQIDNEPVTSCSWRQQCRI
jgi:hypothetical protein